MKGKLDLSQKDSSKKGFEIESLKSKIVELALKISELERLKSEDILVPVVGGDVEKNISKSVNISTVNDSSHLVSASGNKNLSRYFIRRKK